MATYKPEFDTGDVDVAKLPRLQARPPRWDLSGDFTRDQSRWSKLSISVTPRKGMAIAFTLLRTSIVAWLRRSPGVTFEVGDERLPRHYGQP